MDHPVLYQVTPQDRLNSNCISAELFPLDVRSFMAGFTNMVGSLYIFLVVKTYPAMAAAMTTAGAYWFYASIRLRNVIFG